SASSSWAPRRRLLRVPRGRRAGWIRPARIRSWAAWSTPDAEETRCLTPSFLLLDRAHADAVLLVPRLRRLVRRGKAHRGRARVAGVVVVPQPHEPPLGLARRAPGPGGTAPRARREKAEAAAGDVILVALLALDEGHLPVLDRQLARPPAGATAPRGS